MADFSYKQIGLQLDLENWETVNTNFSKVGTDLKTVSGSVDAQNERIDNIVSQSGEDITEIVDARQSEVIGATYGTLRERLDASEEFLLSRGFFLYSPFESTGLQAVFNGGELKQYDGTLSVFSGGSVTLPDNSTNDIVLSLHNLSLQVLPRSLHTGAVRIATVTTMGGQITDVKQPSLFSLPKSRIEKTKKKLRRDYQQVRIALLGDSLTEGAGSGTYWMDLVFNSGQVAQGYNIDGLGHCTVDNFAIGSQTSHYGLAVLGKAVQSNKGKYNSTQVTYQQYTGTKFNTTPITLKDSPVASGKYDLAFVGFGANGGTDNLTYVETIVKTLRDAGTEVIILTQNPSSTDNDYLKQQGEDYAKLADAYGCELCDTWAFVRAAKVAGQTTHADAVHMAQAGHIAYAKAVRSVINSLDQERYIQVERQKTRFMLPADSAKSRKYPNSAEIQFTPFETTGAPGATSVTTVNKNLALLFGGKTTSNAVTTIATGQNAYFGHANPHSLDLLVDWSSPFTAEIYRQDGTVLLGTVTSSYSLSRIACMEGVPIAGLGDMASTKPGYENTSIKIVVTSGTLKLVGVIFYSWKKKEIPISAIDFKGTWNEEAWSYSTPYSKYSDTNGDSMLFEYEGNGFELVLSNRTASGIIDVYVDGELVRPQVDLYTSGLYTYSLRYFPESASNYFDRDYSKHTVFVKLNGVNASAVAPASTNRRLALLNAYVFDAR